MNSQNVMTGPEMPTLNGEISIYKIHGMNYLQNLLLLEINLYVFEKITRS